MTVTVTTHDSENPDDDETSVLSGRSHVLVLNTEAGYELTGHTIYANGTHVLTIKITDREANEAYKLKRIRQEARQGQLDR